MPTTFHLTPTESVTVRRSDHESLEVEARFGPKGSPPPAHFHPDQAEHFEVLAGALRAQVDGREHALWPGDTLDSPAGAAHKMWNEGAEEARVTWRTTPPGRTLEWYAAVDAALAGRDHMPSRFALAVLLREYGDVIRLAG